MEIDVILALDPGPEKTAWMIFDGKPVAWDHCLNDAVLDKIAECSVPVVYEMIASQGMAVGVETFETVFWLGRYHHHAEWLNLPAFRVYRREAKSHLCGSQRATDANIRQALIDLYGGDSYALGGIKCPNCKGRKLVGLGKARGVCTACGGEGWERPPGPLAKIGGHAWAALAVAQTWWDTQRE